MSRRSERPPEPTGDIDRHPDARTPEDVAVLRVESGLYFANADAVRTRILQAAAPDNIRAIVLDAESIPFIDVTASRMLADLTDELHDRDVRLLIAREIGQVRRKPCRRHPVLTNIYPTVQAAVDAVTP
jgi:sulfate permease, SulP family